MRENKRKMGKRKVDNNGRRGRKCEEIKGKEKNREVENTNSFFCKQFLQKLNEKFCPSHFDVSEAVIRTFELSVFTHLKKQFYLICYVRVKP